MNTQRAGGMSRLNDWRKTAKLIDMSIDTRSIEAYAMDYLEAAGQQFGVHFGIQNAVEKAQKHWIAALEKTATGRRP